MTDSINFHISKVENNGRQITLDDQSVWEIYFFDTIKSTLWLPYTPILKLNRKDVTSMLKTNAFYPYETIFENLNNGQMIGARQIE
ncbi:MAG: hypothetical protein OXE92_10080 [Bacteroidetes bacterium]|nr:hypothetical protein [Bacteroidota bacterium]MCY4206056.1 hypothetical protein [Bacteroidota bacterium]